MVSPYLDTEVPFVMAHRGFDTDGLENSMRAFQAAVTLGVRYLETDVHATSDGRLVAFHDDRLDRVTDGTGLVAATPWTRLSRMRIGGVEPIPLLADVLGDLPDVRVNIDVKSAGAVHALVDVLARTNAYDRVCIASFSDRRRRAVLRRLPRPVSSSPGMAAVSAWYAAHRLGRAGRPLGDTALRGTDCLQLPPRQGPLLVNRALVEAIHGYGRQVHVWTINDAATMRRLLADGVDALITDRADIAVRVLAERGA